MKINPVFSSVIYSGQNSYRTFDKNINNNRISCDSVDFSFSKSKNNISFASLSTSFVNPKIIENDSNKFYFHAQSILNDAKETLSEIDDFVQDYDFSAYKRTMTPLSNKNNSKEYTCIRIYNGTTYDEVLSNNEGKIAEVALDCSFDNTNIKQIFQYDKNEKPIRCVNDYKFDINNDLRQFKNCYNYDNDGRLLNYGNSNKYGWFVKTYQLNKITNNLEKCTPAQLIKLADNNK